MRVWCLALFLPVLVWLLPSGCAPRPPASDAAALADYEQTNDPLEPTNRKFYAINNAIDRFALKPAAQAYRKVVPEPLRNGIHNALTNLKTPVKLSNDMLEGKPRRAGDTSMRFVINSTVGVLGFIDVAKGWGYADHDADFGMTLANWGAGEGPFLFLPILGPTDPRDAGGFGIDTIADPFFWVGQGAVVSGLGYAKWGLTALDQREGALDAIDNIKRTALDPYATFRSLYRQHRQSQIEEMQNDKRATVPVWFPQSGQAQ